MTVDKMIVGKITVENCLYTKCLSKMSAVKILVDEMTYFPDV
jgi:hypothetical protein